ncbi:MAG TPA: PCYCGC motif-containing (lipo)protein [Candidatus Acidoferrales bacterium]|nr:PCYCGC motif-containing (lipo)protein [Candidatus Acidoferrales bacterium]
MAGKVRAVLYQEPCYCGCDTNDGHKSLLDCYTTKHASECDICRQEGIYVYEQVQKGKKRRRSGVALFAETEKKLT